MTNLTIDTLLESAFINTKQGMHVTFDLTCGAN